MDTCQPAVLTGGDVIRPPRRRPVSTLKPARDRDGVCLIFTTPLQSGTAGPILQTGKQMFRAVQWLAQDHTA